MAAPAVAELTGRLWDRLPALYRAADEQPGADYPLLRFVSLLGDQAGEIETLYDRLALHDDGAGDWISDLTNPATADAGWLNWLARLAGLDLIAGTGTAETFTQLIIDYESFAAAAADNASFTYLRHHADTVPGGTGPDTLRTALLNLTGARHAGSTGAWERLITPYLIGAARVLHMRIYGGDPWHLQLETYLAETPNPAVVAAVIASAAHAAGLDVTYATRIGDSFDGVAAGFADFDAIVADLATFDALTTWLP